MLPSCPAYLNWSTESSLKVSVIVRSDSVAFFVVMRVERFPLS